MIKYKCDVPISLFKVGDIISEESYSRLKNDLQDCFYPIEVNEVNDDSNLLERSIDMIVDLFTDEKEGELS